MEGWKRWGDGGSGRHVWNRRNGESGLGRPEFFGHLPEDGSELGVPLPVRPGGGMEKIFDPTFGAHVSLLSYQTKSIGCPNNPYDGPLVPVSPPFFSASSVRIFSLSACP